MNTRESHFQCQIDKSQECILMFLM